MATSILFGRPNFFEPSGDAHTVSQKWSAWIEEFEAYADSVGLFINIEDEEDTTNKQQRRALLLYTAGKEVHSPSLMKKSSVWESCWSQFHEAIVKGKLDTCRQLLTSARCSTPLCLGSLSPHYRLRQLDSVAFSKLRTTALHMASLYRRPEFVQLLLEQGSEVTAMDGFGRTPAAVLLEHWPRVTSTTPHPLALSQHASTPGHSDTLLQLWAMQVDSDHPPPATTSAREKELFRQQVTVWRARSTSCLKLLLKFGLGVNEIADRRRASTLLHIAARYDLVDVIELILNVGKGDARNETRSSSCELCSFCKTESESRHASGKLDGDLGMLEHLYKDEEGLPSRLKKLLLRQMRCVVMRSHCCLFRCARSDSSRYIVCPNTPCPHAPAPTTSSTSLLQQPTSSQGEGLGRVGTGVPPVTADVEILNGTAKTALAVAVDRGCLNAAHCLLSYGADVFTSDLYGRSILHFLSERDVTFDLLMREVVRQGVDVHQVDNGGNTALHVAAYMGNLSKVAFLLQVGASPDRANMAGKTPLFLAFQRRDHAARHILLLFLLSSTHVRVRDRLGRVPALLQREENATSFSMLDQLYDNAGTLLRRCVLAVRRAIGVSRLLDMTDLSCLPCPLSVQRVLFGEEEREIVDLLKI